MNTEHKKEMNFKENVYFSWHSEMTPTRKVSKNRTTLDHYVNIQYFIMLSLVLRDLDLTVPRAIKLCQQLKTVN